MRQKLGDKPGNKGIPSVILRGADSMNGRSLALLFCRKGMTFQPGSPTHKAETHTYDPRFPQEPGQFTQHHWLRKIFDVGSSLKTTNIDTISSGTLH